MRPYREEKCHRVRHPRIRRAEWCVHTHGGSSHRDDFEDEFDLLMACVGTFHVAGISYWRFSPLQRLEEFGTWAREMASRSPDRAPMEKAAVSLDPGAGVRVFRRFHDTAWWVDLPGRLRDMERAEETVEDVSVAMFVAALLAEAALWDR